MSIFLLAIGYDLGISGIAIKILISEKKAVGFYIISH